MAKLRKNCLSFFIIGCLINFIPLVPAAMAREKLPEEEKLPAQEYVPEVIAGRKPPEYKSTGLRDPFQTYIIKEQGILNLKPEQLAESKVDFSELRVQGIIWGAKIPQAIINSKVYMVGDKIEDAEIIGIDNKGVSLSSPIGIVNLPGPGRGVNVAQASESDPQVIHYIPPK